MGNWAYLHRLEGGIGGGIGVGMGVVGQQLDPGHKVRAAAAVMVMMGRKKKVVSQYMCCAIKNFPQKEEGRRKKTPDWVGGRGRGGKSKVCPPDVGISHPARPVVVQPFPVRGPRCVFAQLEGMLRTEMLVVVRDINRLSSQRQSGG